MEFHGKIIEVQEPRSGQSPRTGETWTSIDFVVERDSRYPVRICFNIFGSERINELHPTLGEYVTVHFDISARCSNGKWFNDVSCYRIERSKTITQSVNNVADQAVFKTLEEDVDTPY